MTLENGISTSSSLNSSSLELLEEDDSTGVSEPEADSEEEEEALHAIPFPLRSLATELLFDLWLTLTF